MNVAKEKLSSVKLSDFLVYFRALLLGNVSIHNHLNLTQHEEGILKTLLGDYYLIGLEDTKINVNRALQYYKIAVELKYPESFTKLAKLYYLGLNGVKKDKFQAINIWEKGVTAGDKDSDRKSVV